MERRRPLRAYRVRAWRNCRTAVHVVQQPNWLLSFVGYGNGNGNETHLHVESARALGDGIEGRVGLEGGGGADDQAGDGELHGGR